eukprot:TRINITY_DN1379_c0_g1_i1.p1 TRINITY_DN1379_c0_g1~~TRINITY_DN1379_c0_g1_i1.p1  ORF type:complete len:488 (+),score=79.62 TRINITY_DN1379_c0_g1_i1:27-1490(+)
MPETLIVGVLHIRVIKAKNLTEHTLTTCDPYVKLYVDKTQVGKTKIISSNQNPIWHESFRVDLDGRYENFALDVWDSNMIKDTFLGEFTFQLASLQGKEKRKGWHDLQQGQHHTKVKGKIKIKILLQNSHLESYHVKDSYFPLRRDCRVTLYQDAHVGEDNIPEEYANHEQWMVKNNTFEDIYSAISNAKKLVYITGWSVMPSLTLLRRRPIDGHKHTIEELLKIKADEGVRVLLHVWDELLSTSLGFGYIKLHGLMQTFDEEVRKVFENTNVHVQLSHRQGSTTNELIWTHHQKSVMVDVPSSTHPGKRRLIAFVGGLDLTLGRWDTPGHYLYKNLTTDHLNDYHTPWLLNMKVGPREPWHDIHSKVEGEVVYDVITNFEQRWKKQAFTQVHHLLDINEDPDIVKYCFDPEHKEAWNVQFFRSISPQSATIDEVERGIQNAYVNAIRVAKKFIYIENQYFMGKFSILDYVTLLLFLLLLLDLIFDM